MLLLSHLWYSKITKLNISTFRDANERHREASPQPWSGGAVRPSPRTQAAVLLGQGRAARHREVRPGAGGAGVDQQTDR